MQRGGSGGGRPAMHYQDWDRPPRRSDRPGRPPARRASPRRGSGWRRKSLLAKIGYVVATFGAVVAVVASLGFFAVYHQLTGNIHSLKVGHLTGKTVYGALNILVLGSQTRLGQRGSFGYDPTPGVSNSDNLLLVHLDPTHTHATILSIPRDTMVYEPACKERAYVGTGTWPAQPYPPGAIIDGALNIGGPTCAVWTVEDLTGVQLDHFVEFNFNSFRTMVNQFGGVQVCVPPGPGYHDRAANLNLSPGLHTVNYSQALAYVRARHSLGGADAGGDLPRIMLQQAFISSVIKQVNKQGLASDLPRLVGIADTASKALTIDDGLSSPTALIRLARSLAHLKPKNVTLLTMPTTVPTAQDIAQHPSFTDRLLTVQPQDDVLFNMIRTGQTWHGSLPVQSYGSVQVKVINATGQRGLARRTAAALRALGFDVVGTGNATFSSTTTVDYQGLAQADGAYTLMTALTKFPSALNGQPATGSQIGSPGPVTLVLGADFAGVNQPTVAATPTAKASKGTRGSGGTTPRAGPSTGASAVQGRNAGAGICTGLPPAFGG